MGVLERLAAAGQALKARADRAGRVGQEADAGVTQTDQVIDAVIGGHHVVNVDGGEPASSGQTATDDDRHIPAAERVSQRELHALVQQDDAHRLAGRDQREGVLGIGLVHRQDDQPLAHALGVGTELLKHVVEEALPEIGHDHRDDRAGLAAAAEGIRRGIAGLLGHLFDAQAHRLADRAASAEETGRRCGRHVA